MTVEDNTSRNQYIVASSGQTIFAYTFEILDKDHIVVTKNSVTLSEGTDYTVSNVGNSNGGNVTFTTGTTKGDIVTLYRDMPYSRTQNYTNSGDFLASEINSDFDRLWLAGEQTNRVFSQTMRKSVSDYDSANLELPDTDARAGKLLSFDNTGSINMVEASSSVDIQEGAWTPVFTDDPSGGNEPPFVVVDASYTKVGSVVSLSLRAYQIETTGTTGTLGVYVTGLPFTVNHSSSSTIAANFVGSCVWYGIANPTNAIGGYQSIVTETTSPSEKYMQFRVGINNSTIPYSLKWNDVSEYAQVLAQITYFTNE